MIVSKDIELDGLKKVSEAVAITLKKMKAFAKVGMTTKELDDYGKTILEHFGAQSAPFSSYGFPGCTCISINNEMAHGIPSTGKVLKEGDLLNIDISASLNGFYSDNGASFIVGQDVHHQQKLVDASIQALYEAISIIKGGVKIAEVGRAIERVARNNGFKVIRNLGGHGIGTRLHEEPDCILNYYDQYDNRRFKKNMVVAIETFLTTKSTLVHTAPDKWTLTGNNGGFCVQHEHTIVVTSDKPIVLTAMNGIR